MRRSAGLAAVAIAIAILWPSVPAVTVAAEVTFTRDVAPIFYAKCIRCHRDGEAAPITLLTYRDARPWARAIKAKVVARQMPPWFADPAYGTFRNDPTLSAQEIATIGAWVDAGAPQGNPKDMPAPPRFSDGWELGEPDMIVQLPEVQIPATGNDYFPTPSIPLTLDSDRWVRAIEIRPSNRESAHHSMIFTANADVTVRAGAVGSDGTMAVLAAWAHGSPPRVYPEGTGRWLRKGQVMKTNLHYHTNGTPQVDRTRVGLYFGRGALQKEVVGGIAGNLIFEIPPHATHYEVRAAEIVTQDIQVLSWLPHMHVRGKDMRIAVTYPDGRHETLLSVPAFNYDWQLFYYPTTHVSLPRGTRIEVVAHFDNSAANPRNPDPNRPVPYGESTLAEMAFGLFEFMAADGVSPAPSTPRARMEALRASFPDSAYLVNVPSRNGLSIPSVLHIPRSGEGAWYMPTFGIIDVSPIDRVTWTGMRFQFRTSLRLENGSAPFTVTGTVQNDSIRGWLEPTAAIGRVPFKAFAGSRR